MGSFAGAEGSWMERLGNLRNVVRQELIARQLHEHVSAGMRALDVGCGQGTQALRLAESGCRVTGVDPSPDLLDRFRSSAEANSLQVQLIVGAIDELDSVLGDRVYDIVCAHGLLMYLDDHERAITALVERVAPGGKLSLTFRNAHALAFRPGMRRDWSGALAGLDGRRYVNELGVEATAHRLDDVEDSLARAGFDVVAWYGVRVFNDAVAGDAVVPEDENISDLLDVEERAGRTDPYRWFGSQLHVVAAESPSR